MASVQTAGPPNAMIQARLFPDDGNEDGWGPVVSPYRPPRAAGTRTKKPLVGQMPLPGVDEVLLAPIEDRNGMTIAGGRGVCPNCGSTEFDADGDCTICWEPGVVEPAGEEDPVRSPLRVAYPDRHRAKTPSA